MTHGCFQAALRVARRVASETALHRHRVSIPSVAVADFASRVFERFDDKRVLVIGAGEMAQETLQYLTDAGARKIVVLNRDFDRAPRRWPPSGRAAAPWDELHDQLVAADLVVSTTGADRHIVALADFQQHVARRPHQRPLFVLDLAMPRDFDPAIGDELGVYLYGIDDLTEACERNRQARADALPAAERIVDEEVRAFVADTRSPRLGPGDRPLPRGAGKRAGRRTRRGSTRGCPSWTIARAAKSNNSPTGSWPRCSTRRWNRCATNRATARSHGLLEALQRLFQLKEKDD